MSKVEEKLTNQKNEMFEKSVRKEEQSEQQLEYKVKEKQLGKEEQYLGEVSNLPVKFVIRSD